MEKHPTRPTRIQVVNQFGQRRSLDDGAGQFAPMPGCGEPLLLLGLGPDPAALADMIGRQTAAIYLEAPDFARQMPSSWHRDIPGHWRETSCKDLLTSQALRSRALFYRPGLRLFPDFWAPVLAAKSMDHAAWPQVAVQDAVWMPVTDKGLLTRELSRAFVKTGLAVEALPGDMDPAGFMERLRHQRPRLFFSVNFLGLDPYGQIAAALRRLDIPTAVWCVDNPFHLLPALKSSFWKDCTLFVTDDWFIRPLREHGAGHVVHLPLATDPELFLPRTLPGCSGLEQKIVFVGRSSFPEKNAFFAGQAVPPKALSQARLMMDQGLRPDFAWWWNQLGQAPLWPGQNVREIGFVAEQCNQVWRSVHLKAAAMNNPLVVHGDPGWQSLLAGANVELRPMVDYYGPLADIYNQARYTMNLTSLLLPHGLTQRHFDVWAAGGFLITDATPGLNVFDPELARATAFAAPEDAPRLIDRLERERDLVRHLRNEWRRHIAASHTYDHRVESVLNALTHKKRTVLILDQKAKTQ